VSTGPDEASPLSLSAEPGAARPPRRPALTAAEILQRLDHTCAEGVGYAFFPDFGHGYHHHVDQRLTAYGDGSRWVFVIEQVAVNPRGSGIETTLYFHGNAVVLPPQAGWGDLPVKSLALVTDGRSGPIPYDDDWTQRGAADLCIRGQVVTIRRDAEHYRARGIEVQVVSELDVARLARGWRGRMRDDVLRRELRALKRRVGIYCPRSWHVARGLLPEHRDLLLATEDERREGVPRDLPRLLQIDEWRHPRFLDGELPSESESFQRIAEVLARRDARAWRPAERPNTHWKHWPHSGSI
jgi:hypothetical protein